MKYKSNNNVVYSCKYHVVWCPKYRRKVLTGEIEVRLKELIIEVDPQYGINRAVRHIKGVSSHALRSEFPSLKSRLPTLWTNSYFVSTVGGAPLSAVKKYIENQKGV